MNGTNSTRTFDVTVFEVDCWRQVGRFFDAAVAEGFAKEVRAFLGERARVEVVPGMVFGELPKVHRFRCDIDLDGELLAVEAVEPSLADEPYRGRDSWPPEPSFAYFFRASGATVEDAKAAAQGVYARAQADGTVEEYQRRRAVSAME